MPRIGMQRWVRQKSTYHISLNFFLSVLLYSSLTSLMPSESSLFPPSHFFPLSTPSTITLLFLVDHNVNCDVYFSTSYTYWIKYYAPLSFKNKLAIISFKELVNVIEFLKIFQVFKLYCSMILNNLFRVDPLFLDSMAFDRKTLPILELNL